MANEDCRFGGDGWRSIVGVEAVATTPGEWWRVELLDPEHAGVARTKRTTTSSPGRITTQV
jgi:hypothetical protein